MNKMEMLANEYRENKRLIEELEALNEALKEQIISFMGDREEVIEGSAKITNKEVKSSRLDGSRLKEEEPETYKRFLKQYKYKRFTVK